MATRKPTPAGKTAPRIDAERVRQAIQSGVAVMRGFSAEVLAGELELFSLGYLRAAALRFQKIRERDDTIKAVAEKRDLDVALLDWEVLAVDDSPEAKKHKTALEEFYDGLVATHALDQNQRGGVSTLIRQMQRAVGESLRRPRNRLAAGAGRTHRGVSVLPAAVLREHERPAPLSRPGQRVPPARSSRRAAGW
jgi:hypothetical protein